MLSPILRVISSTTPHPPNKLQLHCGPSKTYQFSEPNQRNEGTQKSGHNNKTQIDVCAKTTERNYLQYARRKKRGKYSRKDEAINPTRHYWNKKEPTKSDEKIC